MRHRVAHRKLGRTTPHRTALLRNLASPLFGRGRIRATLPKAKELRPFAEELITLAKREDGRLHARRQAARHLQDPAIVQKLFDTIGARFANRPGGYTRILRLGTRRSDDRPARARGVHAGAAGGSRGCGYRRLRRRVYAGIFVGYAGYYLVRNNLGSRSRTCSPRIPITRRRRSARP